jgi:ABC-type transport system involved in Fe-S cluster assembly fused permease/ATPase subunit
MDPRGEHQIFERIKAIAADRITIVVTHRLENTKLADHIVVLEHGHIAELGRYDACPGETSAWITSSALGPTTASRSAA